MGSWFSNFPIPPCVSRRLRKEKRDVLEYEQRIRLMFTPQGNPRKMLDITVAFIPHEHRQGGTQCNIWHPYGSKKKREAPSGTSRYLLIIQQAFPGLIVIIRFIQ